MMGCTYYPPPRQTWEIPLASTTMIAEQGPSFRAAPWMTEEGKAYYKDLFKTEAWQLATEGLKGKG